MPPAPASHHYYAPPDRTLSPGAVILAFYSRGFPTASARLCSPHWVLDYSFEGGGAVRAGAPERDFLPRPARTAHLYLPGTPYWEEYPAATGIRRAAYIIFRGGDELGLSAFADGGEGWARFRDPRGRLGRLLAGGAREACLAGANGFFRAQAALYRIAECLAGATRDPEGRGWRLDWPLHAPEDDQAWARRVRGLLQRDLAGKIRLDAMAAELSCSVSSLTRRYRRATGQSPGQTLAAMRLHAADLLLRHRYPLKDIAARTGFYDEFHLSKAFRRVHGRPPRRSAPSRDA